MAGEEENPANVRRQLAKVFQEALKRTFPDQLVEPLVAACSGKFGDYQCNNAMGIYSMIRGRDTEFRNPNSVGKAIMGNLPQSDMLESSSVAGAGFINVKLSDKWLAKSIEKMLREGIHTWAPKLPITTVVVDFSSPNIAKEMHVGHLRSTIIGDTLARMLEFSGVEVLRRNHVGDWGTQFGMLIEFLFEEFPQWEDETEIPIRDLQAFYKQSKKRFDDDPAFKKKAQMAVVSLQGGDPKYRKVWTQICEVSRKEFQKVYERLAVHLEEKGESFYNPFIHAVLKGLDEKGLIEDSEGARVIYIDRKEKPLKKVKAVREEEEEGEEEDRKALIVIKRDGGFNYASTDLTALWYRLNVEKAQWILYVTDKGQKEHFDMVFGAAKRAGWLLEDEKSYPKASHVEFGVVLGDDGKKFRTRSSEVVRLVDLLDEAKNRSKEALIERGKAEEWTVEELEETAEAVGYGAVKYADLKNNRSPDYTFNFEQMLSDKGKTAVYLLYAHARICSIIRKSGKDVEELKESGEIALNQADERALGVCLLKFSEVVEDAVSDLLPNTLCEYLYDLSDLVTKFCTKCKVVGSAEETSRLLLCEATTVVMRKCFHLLGITPVYKM